MERGREGWRDGGREEGRGQYGWRAIEREKVGEEEKKGRQRKKDGKRMRERCAHSFREKDGHKVIHFVFPLKSFN